MKKIDKIFLIISISLFCILSSLYFICSLYEMLSPFEFVMLFWAYPLMCLPGCLIAITIVYFIKFLIRPKQQPAISVIKCLQGALAFINLIPYILTFLISSVKFRKLDLALKDIPVGFISLMVSFSIIALLIAEFFLRMYFRKKQQLTTDPLSND